MVSFAVHFLRNHLNHGAGIEPLRSGLYELMDLTGVPECLTTAKFEARERNLCFDCDLNKGLDLEGPSIVFGQLSSRVDG